MPEPAPVRDEPPLPDDAIVVRGGVMNYADLEVAAVTNYEEFAEYAISVYSEVGLTAREIHEKYLPHPRARVSMARRIRTEGYDLKPTHDPGHYDLVLPNPPTVSDWEKLHKLFDVTIKRVRGAD